MIFSCIISEGEKNWLHCHFCLLIFNLFPNTFETRKQLSIRKCWKQIKCPLIKGVGKLNYCMSLWWNRLQKRVLCLYVLIQKGILDILVIENSTLQNNNYGMNISVKIYMYTTLYYILMKIYKMVKNLYKMGNRSVRVFIFSSYKLTSYLEFVSMYFFLTFVI